jgi:ParB/RepB/Spo0J family partition protein
MTATLDDQLTVPTLPVDRIRRHRANPRRDASADDAMVSSITQQGLLEPLMVAPAEGEDGWWVLIDGHRRLDGCEKAGVAEVPVNPRYDLVTEAQQVEVMVITGLQKDLLTPVEEAAGYEQLMLQGLDVDAIAAATGFSRRRVQGRLALNDLPDTARDSLHFGQATLADAEALIEFADDLETTATLNELFGSSNFRLEVQNARARRDRLARNQAIIDGYIELGATKGDHGTGVRTLRSFGEGKLAEPKAHKGCLGWLGEIDSFAEPYLVCTKPTKHKTTATGQGPETQPDLSDWEKQQEERAAARAAAEAATAARLEFLRGHIAGLFPTRGNAKLAGLAQALLPMLLTDGRDHVEVRTLITAFGLTIDHTDPASYYGQVAAAKAGLCAAMTIASPAKALGGLADWVSALVAEQLATDPQYVDDADEVRYQLMLWDWLGAAGYVVSDADKAARAAVEQRIAELDSEKTEVSDEDGTG